jgi:hypothetical protein
MLAEGLFEPKGVVGSDVEFVSGRYFLLKASK